MTKLCGGLGWISSVCCDTQIRTHSHTTAPSRLPFCPTHIIFLSWPFKSTPLNLPALSHTTCVINMFRGRFVKPLVHQFMLWLHAYSLCIREIKQRPQMPLTCIKVCINFKLVYLLLVIVKKKKHCAKRYDAVDAVLGCNLGRGIACYLVSNFKCLVYYVFTFLKKHTDCFHFTRLNACKKGSRQRNCNTEKMADHTHDLTQRHEQITCAWVCFHFTVEQQHKP